MHSKLGNFTGLITHIRHNYVLSDVIIHKAYMYKVWVRVLLGTQLKFVNNFMPDYINLLLDKFRIPLVK